MPPPAEPAVDKNYVRKTMRERRREVRAAEITESSLQIAERVARLIAGARCVGLFAGIGGEVSLRVDGLAEPGRTFAWPRCVAATRSLTFHASTAVPVVPGTHGIPEPSPERPIAPRDLDAIVVPGLAFTRDGARLGEGAGYYDRFLPDLRSTALRIGVCYGWQIVDRLPMEHHDVRMTHVVTETDTWAVGV